jgi:flagellar FliL protein
MKKVIIISVALLLLAGGGAAAYMFLLKEDAPAATAEGGAEAAPVVEEKDPIYFGLNPEFIINYEHGGSTRYLQMSLQIMAHDQEVIDKVEANMPAVRNTLIMLLSGKDFDVLGTQEGKQTLRADVLAAINETVKFPEASGVKEVYFTAFVMQ